MNLGETTLEIHSGIVLKGQLSMVKDVVLTGKFEGDLKTLGRLTVSSGGIAVGSIEAGALVLEPGNLVEARVKITSPGIERDAGDSSTRKNNVSSSKWPLSLKKLKDLALGLR